MATEPEDSQLLRWDNQLLRVIPLKLRVQIFELVVADSVIDEYDLPSLLRVLSQDLYCEALPYFKQAFQAQNYTVTTEEQAEFLAKPGREKQLIKNLTIIDPAPLHLGNNDPPYMTLQSNPIKLRNNIVELKLEYLPCARQSYPSVTYPTELIRASFGKCRKFTVVFPYSEPGSQRNGQDSVISGVNGNLGINGVLSATRNGMVCVWTINAPLRRI